MSSVADRIAQVLLSVGVRRVYGLPGEDHLELLDAFGRCGITYFTAAEETSAVIMAATDAEASGVVGVCLLSMAPGVSNAVNGVLHAHMEGLPLLVLSGQRSPEALPMLVRQGFDFELLLRPLVKWATRLDAASDVAQVLRKAISIARADKAGPVYLEVPASVAAAEFLAAAPEPERSVAAWEVTPSGDTPAAIEELAAAVRVARRPVLIVGGRTSPDAAGSIAAFAEALRCPVFTTPKRAGLFASGFEFDCGTFLNGNLESQIIGASDLLMMTDPVAFDYYNRPWPYHVQPHLLCSSMETLEFRLPFQHALVGPLTAAFDALTVHSEERRSEWSAADVARYRAHVRDTLLAPEGFTVARAVDAALQARPPGVHLVADAGFSKPLSLMLQELSAPDRFFGSNALSTMGFAIPAGMGVSRAGGGPVLALVGDGSLLMTAGELALHTGLQQPIAVVASLDAALTQIQVKQRRQRLRDVGTALPSLSCRDLGRAFGVPGYDVTSASELRDAVSAVWDGEAIPHLIGAHVDAGASQDMYELVRG